MTVAYLPLTARELDAMGCANPRCTESHAPLILRARCHPEASIYALYLPGKATLEIVCAECDEGLTAVRVASG